MKKTFSIAYKAIKGYSRHGSVNLAAGISFYAILSIVPVLFILVSIIGLILGHSDDLFSKIITAIENVIPDLSPQLVDALKGMIRHSHALGWMGLGVLLWSSDMALSAVANALETIFESSRRRRFIIGKLISLGLILGCGFALVVSFSLPSMLSALAKSNVLLSLVIPFLLPLLAFMAVVSTLTVASIRFRHLAAGAVLFSVFWEAAKVFFGWYIKNVAKINIIYSSLGSMFITILWIFYSANIFLFCAEIVAALRVPAGPPDPGNPND